MPCQVVYEDPELLQMAQARGALLMELLEGSVHELAGPR